METNCSIHKNRPASNCCSNCGNYICYECSIQLMTSSRTTVTGFGSGGQGQVIERYFSNFCPHCFISLSRKKGYDKPARIFINPNFLRDEKHFLGFGILLILFLLIIAPRDYYGNIDYSSLFSMIFFLSLMIFICAFIMYMMVYTDLKDRHKDFERAKEIIKDSEFK